MTRIPTIAELMSRELICVRHSDTCAGAYRTMVRAGIHHLPVIDDERHLVGVLNSKQLMEPPTRPRADYAVKAHVLRPEVTLTDDIDALEATDLMLKSNLDALPVVDRNSKLLGVITETDLLRALRGIVVPVTNGKTRRLA